MTRRRRRALRDYKEWRRARVASVEATVLLLPGKSGMRAMLDGEMVKASALLSAKDEALASRFVDAVSAAFGDEPSAVFFHGHMAAEEFSACSLRCGQRMLAARPGSPGVHEMLGRFRGP